MANIVKSLRPGDKVTIEDRFGVKKTGKVVMRSSYAGKDGEGAWVLNMGGRSGTPAIADNSNIVKVVPTRKPGPNLGNARSGDRFTVSGPAGWRRSVHTSYDPAIEAAHACAKKHPNAVCKVAAGLPGMQRTVAECNRNECYGVNDLNARRRSAAKRSKKRR